ncbi:hypothetical protein BJ742DRAFT_773427 [Cladochytrium replicatum]|nr:hypothetical protein BJ742DRAFT_773427 [Cladochytrium replicatum]
MKDDFVSQQDSTTATAMLVAQNDLVFRKRNWSTTDLLLHLDSLLNNNSSSLSPANARRRHLSRAEKRTSVSDMRATTELKGTSINGKLLAASRNAKDSSSTVVSSAPASPPNDSPSVSHVSGVSWPSWLSWDVYSAANAPPASTLSHISSLDLSLNRLSSLPPRLAHHLPSLTRLNLAHNQLADLPASLLAALPSLTVLNLQSNALTTFPPADLPRSALRNLRYLRLDDNKLRYLDTSIVQFAALESLVLGSDFGGNQLTELPTGVFPHMHGLTELVASRNELVCLPEDIGSEGSALKTIDVAENKLESIPASIGLCSNLTKLNLGRNKLVVVPTELADLPVIEHLDLSNNRITILPHELTTFSKAQIILAGNPITHMQPLRAHPSPAPATPITSDSPMVTHFLSNIVASARASRPSSPTPALSNRSNTVYGLHLTPTSPINDEPEPNSPTSLPIPPMLKSKSHAHYIGVDLFPPLINHHHRHNHSSRRRKNYDFKSSDSTIYEHRRRRFSLSSLSTHLPALDPIPLPTPTPQTPTTTLSPTTPPSLKELAARRILTSSIPVDTTQLTPNALTYLLQGGRPCFSCHGAIVNEYVAEEKVLDFKGAKGVRVAVRFCSARCRIGRKERRVEVEVEAERCECAEGKLKKGRAKFEVCRWEKRAVECAGVVGDGGEEKCVVEKTPAMKIKEPCDGMSKLYEW